jgi:hypothetical protein
MNARSFRILDWNKKVPPRFFNIVRLHDRDELGEKLLLLIVRNNI